MAKQEDGANAPADGSAKLPTIEEHALATGNVKPMTFEFFTRTRPQDRMVFSAEHAAAAALHGWNAHAHHANETFRCTREAYEAALKAAAAPVTRTLDKDGKPGPALDAEQVAKLNGSKPLVHVYEPHTAALSKHAPKSHAAKAEA